SGFSSESFSSFSSEISGFSMAKHLHLNPWKWEQSARLGSFELPRGEAAMVQMVPTDVRPLIESLQCIPERLPLKLRTGSKFELELHLATGDRIPTSRARHPWTPITVRAARLGRWQFPASDRFAGFAANDRLVPHGGSLMHVHAHRVAWRISGLAGALSSGT